MTRSAPGLPETPMKIAIEWIREIHPRTAWTTSVCTGARLRALATARDRRSPR